MRARDGLIAMHQLQGVGRKTLQYLWNAGWSFETDCPLEQIKNLEDINISSKALRAIRQKWTPSFIRHVQTELKKRKIEAITIMDEEYPRWLKEIPDPPLILYVKGNKHLLHRPCLGMVGTRKPTPYGLQVTHSLASSLVEKGWVVVSGMAYGIDRAAHEGALEKTGATIAVLAGGVDVIYPKRHQSLYHHIIEQGLVVAEMPPGTTAQAGLFPQRNRIISGLSRGTIVVEAAQRSGSLITADYSLEQNREVFAVPGPITSLPSQGTNRLIQQGAKCLTSIADITEEFIGVCLYPMEPERDTNAGVPEGLTEEEQHLLEQLQSEPISIEGLLEQNKEMESNLHTLLLSLEMKGKIKQLPGANVMRV
ncbi:DNA-processing protein DprA [Mechercharimyces sp. CAU 1602]|uniref:DNA-processing protein DprA n=1 Tax=Mechercharimyces sp. CAU 1602 TaxID=2973933 RepID=UPI002162C5F5|nr:DNA-processing protein DprA [Mechercharimyces sp. CAU 1602]MCS1351309.1 DNA-processing protein DprA [Mechercharimyces sp. CAU 1602]